MDRYTLDTSAILYAWDEYPTEHFPSLWNWLADQLQSEHIIILKVALDESKKYEACHRWLKDKNIKTDSINQGILDLASEIKKSLGIIGDTYHGEGVGENDIFIIAHARYIDHILITEESRQPKLPNNIKKCKIPAVCDMIGSRSCRFIEMIQNSGARF